VLSCISFIVPILDQMTSSELDALAVKLHAQISRTSHRSKAPKIELEDVKAWIALHKKEGEFDPDPSFFLSLV
jgi:hypothetical protein